MEKQQSVEFELFGRTGMATTAHRCKSKRVSLRMTFIAGFNCADGIVLCAEQLETDGVTKRYRCKIEGVIMDEEWAISWAGSGDGHVIDKFTDKLKRALLEVGPEFNQAEIELAVEAALTLINQDHPRNPFK